jgi:PEP-CTERM motif-containing protein
VKKLWMTVAVAVAFVALPGIAHADAVYQVGGAFTCPSNSCLGGSYTLTFVGNNSGNTFDVTLRATTPTSGAAFGDFITSVEFGDGKGISSASLTSTSVPGGVGSWGTTVFGNLSNAGCGSGPAPNVCNNQVLNGFGQYTLAPANGSTYSWTWHVVFATPGLDLNEADMHIGLQYENGANTSNGLIVSESGVSTRVPEPSSLFLLGVGLCGIVCLGGRKLITS